MLGNRVELAIAAAHQAPQVAVVNPQPGAVNTVAAKKVGQRVGNRRIGGHGIRLNFVGRNRIPVIRRLG